MSNQGSSDKPKPTNPKDLIGVDKIPMHLWPASATVYGAIGLLVGRCKYGRSNYRAMGVSATIYIDALKRHTADYEEGNDIDESGAPNLAHMLACVAILVEATEQGNLQDDRAYSGNYYRAMVARFTPLVAQIREQYAHLEVKHYTIQDNPGYVVKSFTFDRSSKGMM